MAKAKKILMLTDGNYSQASARIRALEYIPYLEQSGFSVTTVCRIPAKRKSLFDKLFWFPLLKRLYLVKRIVWLLLFRWDVIFIQRSFINPEILRIAGKHARVIYDFDDAVFYNPVKPSDEQKAANMVLHSDNVIIGSPFLGDFCHKNGKEPVFIPTPVDCDQIQVKNVSGSGPVVIGWIGSPWTTPYLEPLLPVLCKIAGNQAISFVTVGFGSAHKITGVRHTDYPWQPGVEAEVLRQIDIGIMPLPDDFYSRAKGGYKLYLYQAAGIPCVASPVGINREIVINEVNGYLADSLPDWEQSLLRLIYDPELRIRLGKSGRASAEAKYDRKVTFSKLLTVINS